MKSKSIYKAVEYFCRTKDAGLLVIDSPPGSGKSHQIREYITDNYVRGTGGASQEQMKRCIWITSHKNNLPTDMVRGPYSKDVLFLESTLDNVIQVIDAWESGNSSEHVDSDEVRRSFAGKVFREVQNSPEWNALVAAATKYIKAERDKTPYAEVIEDRKETAWQAERAFRESIRSRLKSWVGSGPQAMYRENADLIAHMERKSSSLHWIGLLYPAIYLPYRSILLMSVKKFVHPIDVIMGPTVYLLDEDCPYTDHALIVMDEFDACRQEMLDVILDRAAENQVDMIELFRNIWRALTTGEFSAAQLGEYPLRIIQKNRDLFDQYYNQYHLSALCKAEEGLDLSSNGWLFQDEVDINPVGSNQTRLYLRYDDAGINWITDQKPENTDAVELSRVLQNVDHCIRHFVKGINMMAQSASEHLRSPEQSREDLVRSLVKMFGLASGEDFIVNQVLARHERERQARTGHSNSRREQNLYSRGFRCYILQNSNRNRQQTVIHYYCLKEFPELQLLSLARRDQIAALSASASMQTNVNFNLAFLKAKLGENYCTPHNTEDIVRDCSRIAYRHYDRVQIPVQLIGPETFDSDHTPPEGSVGMIWRRRWTLLLNGNAENGAIADRILQDALSLTHEDENSRDFYMSRCFQYAWVFREFVRSGDIRSFLCITNAFPKDEMRSALMQIFCLIVKSEHAEDSIWSDKSDSKSVKINGTKIPKYYFQLDSKDHRYDVRKKELLRYLAEGKKVFVLSSYNTIGSGQNLQYRIPDADRDHLVTINDLKPDERKDFDAVYVESPTFLLEDISRSDKDAPSKPCSREFISFLYQSLQLYELGDISYANKMGLVRRGFRCLIGGRLSGTNMAVDEQLPRNSYSVLEYCSQRVMQAIGRISRTNRKSPVIHIYADERLKDHLGEPPAAATPEYAALYRELMDGISEEEWLWKRSERVFLRAAFASKRAMDHITGLLLGWDKEVCRAEWIATRRFLAAHPTITFEEAARLTDEEKKFLSLYYIDLNGTQWNGQLANVYFRVLKGDYQEIVISPLKDHSHPYTISAETSNLLRVMKCEPIARYFDGNGFAREFTNARYVMQPRIAQRVYMGALGEFGGTTILENDGIRLEEISEHFEKFDAKIVGLPVYVDFKNWHRNLSGKRGSKSDAAPGRELETSRDKALRNSGKIADCECVVILNLIADSNTADLRITDERMSNGKRLVMIPSLLNKSHPEQICREALQKLHALVGEYTAPAEESAKEE